MLTDSENKVICKCKNVTVLDIEKALGAHKTFEDVDREFEHVRDVTHCSTGCGGCHDKILDVISQLING